MSDQKKHGAVVTDELVNLIENMTPFLDSSGRAFCYMPHADESKRGILSLRDRQVRSYLRYRYHKEFNAYPGKERVNDAIDYIEGKLLANRKGPIVSSNCPVLRCFLQAVEEDDSGSGSADDILKMLRRINTEYQLLKGREKLPKNSTAMGKWLVKNLLLLQANGIEVFRPPRGSKKRRWDWRQIFRDDDTSDTSATKVSQGASLRNPEQSNENGSNVTLTDEILTEMLKEVQS